MAYLPRVFLPQHSQADFRALRNDPPNRVCFATVHAHALKENTGPYNEARPFKFSVPFRHGVVWEFHKGTGLQLRQSQFGYWAPLTAAEAELVRAWMIEQGTRVYLKDLFDCSVALGERSIGNGETELGRLFTAAKYDQNQGSIAELAKRATQAFEAMSSFANVAAISCPPPRPDKVFDLPTIVAQQMAKKARLPFVRLGDWKGAKGQLKEVPADQKWQELEKVGFSVNPALTQLKGDTLIVDDIYQSGTTLNFLRSQLTALGLARATSMSLVKAARDTDNQ